MRRLTPLLAWDAVLALAALGLVRLPLPAGAMHDDPVLAVFAAVRLVLLVWVALLAGVTSACAGAILLRVPGRAVAVLAHALPAPIARAALATAGMTFALPMAPAAAAAPAPVMRKLPPEVPVAVAPPPSQPSAGEAATPEAAGGEHTVRPGDSLWSIAEANVAERLGRPASVAETHAYWRRVIEVNADRAPDPDLIHPGDAIRLPPT